MLGLLTSYLKDPAVLFLLTLAFFIMAETLYIKANKHPMLNPMVTGSVPLGLLLLFLNIDKATYESSGQYLLFLLAPAVVTLGVPVYTFHHTIRQHFWPIVLTVLWGAFNAALIAVIIAVLCHAQESTIRAVIAKSVTTPIAIEVVRFMQGNIPLIVAVVVITGMFGALITPWLLDKMKITDDRVIGLVLGITSHGIGVVRAFDYGTKVGAFASLGMALCGIVTAITVGLLVQFGL